MNPNRALLRAALVVLALLAFAACGGGGSSDAASINGQIISNEEFERELAALAENEALAAEAQADGVEILVDGELAPELQATWLTEVINSALVTQGVEEEDVTVTDADRADAEAGIVTMFGSQAVVDAFPDWFRERLVERQAELVALSWHLAGGRVGDDEASKRAFFEAEIVPAESVYCARHILVEDEATAQDLTDQLRGGADFAALAATYSGDPGSKDSGGDLGCNPAGMFVPEFAAALASQPVGEVGDPVQSQFGYHVILVDSVQSVPVFEDYADEIDARIQEQVRQQLQEWMMGRVDAADISINSKYGELVQQGGSVYVAPPAREASGTLVPDTGTP